MSEQPEEASAREAAAVLLMALEAHDWEFHLADGGAGSWTVIIGDTPPKMTQSQVLWVIKALKGELLALMRERSPRVQ